MHLHPIARVVLDSRPDACRRSIGDFEATSSQVRRGKWSCQAGGGNESQDGNRSQCSGPHFEVEVKVVVRFDDTLNQFDQSKWYNANCED